MGRYPISVCSLELGKIGYHPASLGAQRMGLNGARIFVTGNTGFSGVWLSVLLEQLGATTLGYSRDDTSFSTLFKPKDFFRRWPTTRGLIEDIDSLELAARRFAPDLIVHLAAQSLVRRGIERPLETFQTNSLGTVNVLEVGRSLPTLRGLLIVTTDKVYREGDDIKLESSELDGNDPYSASKVAAEQAVKAYRDFYHQNKVPLAVVRGGNIIGGGDWSENRLVPDIIRSYNARSVLNLRYPNATRPWQHVLDLNFAYAEVLERMIRAAPGASTEFNVGPDYSLSISVRQVVQIFAEAGFPVNFKAVNPSDHEAAELRISSEKIMATLGWEPLFRAKEGMVRTAQWYRRFFSKEASAIDLVLSDTVDYLGERK